MVLKRALLALAISAAAMVNQVSATETTVQEQVTATGATSEEIKVAAFLAEEVTAGRMTLADVSALASLQDRRDQRGQVIRWVVIGTVVLIIACGVSYGVYKYVNKDAKAAEKAPKKAVVAEPAAVVAEPAAAVVAEPAAAVEADEEVVEEAPKAKAPTRGRKGKAAKRA